MPLDPREHHTWQAEYSNGSILNQYNDDGSKNSYRQIERKGLKTFSLLSVESGETTVTIELSPKKRLIWRMRTAKNLYNGTEIRVYIVGWQQKVRGRNEQEIHCVFPDGRVETLDRFRENHPWAYPVQFNDAEKL